MLSNNKIRFFLFVLFLIGVIAIDRYLDFLQSEDKLNKQFDSNINLSLQEPPEHEQTARIMYITIEFNSLIEDINNQDISKEELPKYRQRIDNVKSIIDLDKSNPSWNNEAKNEFDKIYSILEEKSIEPSFEELFNKYLSDEEKLYCKEKNKDVRYYYLAKNLAIYNQELAIEYYKMAISHDIQEIDKSIIYEAIADLYYKLNDFHSAIYWYKELSKIKKEFYNCNLALSYEEIGDFENAYLNLELGYNLKDICATHQLGTYYYNGVVNGYNNPQKGGELWLEAYELYKAKNLQYNAQITYNLGLYYSDFLKDYEKARYFFAISSLAGDSDANKRLNKTSRLYSMDMSNYFLKELIHNKKFDINKITTRYRSFIDNNAFLSSHIYITSNIEISLDEDKITISSKDKNLIKQYLQYCLDILYIDKYSKQAIKKIESSNEDSTIFLMGLDVKFLYINDSTSCEITIAK
ncbi:MAG: hypothetical protein GX118_01600 [Arcobacter butzleri]|nr:hypothetical protein [Arcobacteraceae bacterium]NLO16877.1 hypothetical protein [Aliarcobacter butzleri]